MCGRFTSSQRREAIGERFEVAVPETYSERYNLAPQQRALIVRGREGERDAVMAKWGLLPHWAKDSKIAFKMINARAETLGEKPAYRSLLTRHRCLVPADGFYEWRKDPDGKRPVWITLPNRELFAFAGLWSESKDDDGSDLVSCTIITTEPTEEMRPIHNRMPVILPRDAEATWLAPDADPKVLGELLGPGPEGLEFREVGDLVNSVSNDSPELIEPYVPEPKLF